MRADDLIDKKIQQRVHGYPSASRTASARSNPDTTLVHFTGVLERCWSPNLPSGHTGGSAPSISHPRPRKRLSGQRRPTRYRLRSRHIPRATRRRAVPSTLGVCSSVTSLIRFPALQVAFAHERDRTVSYQRPKKGSYREDEYRGPESTTKGPIGLFSVQKRG